MNISNGGTSLPLYNRHFPTSDTFSASERWADPSPTLTAYFRHNCNDNFLKPLVHNADSFLVSWLSPWQFDSMFLNSSLDSTDFQFTCREPTFHRRGVADVLKCGPTIQLYPVCIIIYPGWLESTHELRISPSLALSQWEKNKQQLSKALWKTPVNRASVIVQHFQ